MKMAVWPGNLNFARIPRGTRCEEGHVAVVMSAMTMLLTNQRMYLVSSSTVR